jgi:hypothetical protein
VGRIIGLAPLVLLITSLAPAFAQNAQKAEFRFINVADTTQGFSSFATFPAINNHGAVAFEAMGTGFADGVFKWQDDRLTPIATTASNGLTFFGIDPVINSEGVVAYEANLTPITRGIFTSDGIHTKTVLNSTNAGIIGRFLSSISINREGAVAFLGVRAAAGFPQAIFVGNGGPLTIAADTLNSNFTAFQNAAINASGEVTFVAFSTDGSSGLFVERPQRDENGATQSGNTFGEPIDLVDTNDPDFLGFGDPVINKFGTVADFAIRSDLSTEIISANSHGVTARTNILNPPFSSTEHPSINDADAVAFSAIRADGSQVIFLEMSGGDSLIPVIQTGDALFGSTVTSVDLGRFALNDSFQLAFEYVLQNGQTGVAVASLRREEYKDAQ